MVCSRCLAQLSVEMRAVSYGSCQVGNHDKVRSNCKQCFDSNQPVLLLLPFTATCCQVRWWILCCQGKAWSPQAGYLPTPVWLSLWWKLQICSRTSWVEALERCGSLHVWALLLALLVCTSLCTYIQVHVGTPQSNKLAPVFLMLWEGWLMGL